jgi:hypothetical protein
MSYILQEVAAPATVTSPGNRETIVLVDTSDAGWSDSDVITLPTPGAGVDMAGRVTVKDVGGEASTKSIVVSGSVTIDSAVSYTIAVPYGSLRLVYMGIEWKVI